MSRYLAAGHQDNDFDGLFRMSRIHRMPFGKYKGLLLSRVPADYVDWLLDRDIDEELRRALQETLGPRIERLAVQRRESPS